MKRLIPIVLSLIFACCFRCWDTTGVDGNRGVGLFIGSASIVAVQDRTVFGPVYGMGCNCLGLPPERWRSGFNVCVDHADCWVGRPGERNYFLWMREGPK